MVYKGSVAFSAGCRYIIWRWCWSLWVEGGGGRYRKTE